MAALDALNQLSTSQWESAVEVLAKPQTSREEIDYVSTRLVRGVGSTDPHSRKTYGVALRMALKSGAVDPDEIAELAFSEHAPGETGRVFAVAALASSGVSQNDKWSLLLTQGEFSKRDSEGAFRAMKLLSKRRKLDLKNNQASDAAARYEFESKLPSDAQVRIACERGSIRSTPHSLLQVLSDEDFVKVFREIVNADFLKSKDRRGMLFLSASERPPGVLCDLIFASSMITRKLCESATKKEIQALRLCDHVSSFVGEDADEMLKAVVDRRSDFDKLSGTKTVASLIALGVTDRDAAMLELDEDSEQRVLKVVTRVKLTKSNEEFAWKVLKKLVVAADVDRVFSAIDSVYSKLEEPSLIQLSEFFTSTTKDELTSIDELKKSFDSLNKQKDSSLRNALSDLNVVLRAVLIRIGDSELEARVSDFARACQALAGRSGRRRRASSTTAESTDASSVVVDVCVRLVSAHASALLKTVCRTVLKFLPLTLTSLDSLLRSLDSTHLDESLADDQVGSNLPTPDLTMEEAAALSFVKGMEQNANTKANRQAAALKATTKRLRILDLLAAWLDTAESSELKVLTIAPLCELAFFRATSRTEDKTRGVVSSPLISKIRRALKSISTTFEGDEKFDVPPGELDAFGREEGEVNDSLPKRASTLEDVLSSQLNRVWRLVFVSERAPAEMNLVSSECARILIKICLKNDLSCEIPQKTLIHAIQASNPKHDVEFLRKLNSDLPIGGCVSADWDSTDELCSKSIDCAIRRFRIMRAFKQESAEARLRAVVEADVDGAKRRRKTLKLLGVV